MFQRAGWVAVLIAVLLAAPASGKNAARVLESSDTEILIELATDTYSQSEKMVGGESFMSLRAPGLDYTDEPGLPRLPRYVAIVAVPFGSSLKLDVLSVESENLGAFNPIPAPHEDMLWDGQMSVPTQDFTTDESYYRGSGTYPATVVELGGQGTLRHQRIASVVFHPFQHSAGTGTLTLHGRILVRISIEATRRPTDLEAAIPNEPEWERTYDHLILNPQQAREWRMRPSPDRAGAGRQGRLGTSAFKITTLASGLHRVDYSELAAAGLTPDAPVEDLAVYQRSFDAEQQDPFLETPVAISVVDVGGDGYFDGTDYLLFQARSFEEEYMTVGYEDRYGDENAYWFSADPNLALRMETRPGWLDEPGLQAPVSFRDTVRFEEDVYFYARPVVIDIDLYHWTSYAAQGDNHSLPFALHGIEPGGDVRLRARYQGMASVPHSIDIRVAHGDTSDHFVGRFEFSGVSQSMSQDIYESGSIPTWFLADGDNYYKTAGTSGLSYANLDWFEFRYDRLFAANAGRLSFTNAGEQGVSEFEVSGFDSSDIRLFDTTDPRRPVELALDPANVTQGEDGYTVRFQDDVSRFTRYE
ncbi:MAG: hypothetical protein JXB46_05595, partial [Candidatus Eisenbacteria bacterium]|nr:hypothetical protein [Candidatus Eisenbacteria bacterium]